MNSLKKMTELADRFESKLSQAQAKVAPPMKRDEGGNPQVIRDAFFAAQNSSVTKGRDQTGFVDFVNQQGSNFQNSIAGVSGPISIGVKVNAPGKAADFIVRSPNKAEQIRAALTSDFQRYYGKSPVELLAARIGAGEVDASTVGSVGGVIDLK